MMRKKLILEITAVFLVVWVAAGCVGPGGKTVSIGDSQPTDTVVVPSKGSDYVQRGIDYFNSGAYSQAVDDFQYALSHQLTAGERERALSALGWAMAKRGDSISSSDTGSVIFVFNQLGSSTLADYTNQNVNDARVGLACAYISRGRPGDIARAIELIERIDPDDSDPANIVPNKFFAYVPSINNGMTNGMVHALLAYCYFCQGQIQQARDQMEYAYQIEPTNETVKIIRTNLTLLGLYR